MEIHRVQRVRAMSPGVFLLRFDRRRLLFEPGQHVILGLAGSPARREYSLYSGVENDFLEVLVREIPGGAVSPALARCRPGDALSVEGPHGLFVTDEAERARASYLFVGSGTGISPFHSMVRSSPSIDYLLLHGVRTRRECHGHDAFEKSRTVACISRQEGGDFHGRVTTYLDRHPVDPSLQCYLCGNGAMIDEAFAILRGQGVPRDRIFSEVYF
jgi:ferredoxin/flavodoxin---NADP+ reductase